VTKIARDSGLSWLAPIPVAVLALVFSLLGMWTPRVVATVLAVLVSLSLPFIPPLRARHAWLNLALVIVGASALVVAVVRPEARLPGGFADGVAVEELARHPSAAAFRLSNGHVLLEDRASSAIRTGRRGATIVGYATVAPLVPEGWRGNIVPAWVVTNPHDNSARHWAEPWRGGLRVVETDEIAKSIADAERRHALASAPGAPLLRWTSAPEQDLSAAIRSVVWLALSAAAAMLGLVLIDRAGLSSADAHSARRGQG
jgi:hypothetical protein